MLEWLPEVGGIAAGAIVAALIEFGKAMGWWDENHAGIIVVVFAAVWAGAIAAMGAWPVAQPWLVTVVRILAMLLSVPVGAKYVGYESVVKPLAQKRWNKRK